MTKAEHYLDRVKSCNCVVCLNRLGKRTSPCYAHHVGTGEDRHPFGLVALCAEHHQGVTGVHGMHRRAFYTFWKCSEVLLLAWTTKEICA